MVDMSKNVAFMSCEKALKKPWQAMLSFHEGPATHTHKAGEGYICEPTYHNLQRPILRTRP